jgi:hypothetical protein
MSYWLNQYCQLFGYYSCSTMSTLETLVLFGIIIAAAPIIILILCAVIYGFFYAVGQIFFGLFVVIYWVFHPVQWWRERRR